MRFHWFPYLLGVSLLVSACGQTPVAVAVPAATNTVEVVATTLPPSTEAVPSQPVGDSTPASSQPPCQVSPSIPVADPQFTAAIPPVTESDWILGSKDAKITLMEFSDFQ